ncbi:hypothetical protein NQ317_000603, partial [Molorchus minor]
IFDQLSIIKHWLLNCVLSFFSLIINTLCADDETVYESIKPEFIAFNKLVINKTFPTPCDHEMWLYNLNGSMKFPLCAFQICHQQISLPYVVDRIPNTNLLFLALNGNNPACEKLDEPNMMKDHRHQKLRDIKAETDQGHHKSPEPREILYKSETNTRTKNALPCYIAIKNNFTRRTYMNCFSRSKK